MNRTEVEAFIRQEFGGVIVDYPWESTPSYAVYRHTENRKWFALVANVDHQALHLGCDGEVDFINLKCDPDLIDDLLREPGILPAYHMNKRHWIAILLDRNFPVEQLQSLVALSYRLTSKTHRSR